MTDRGKKVLYGILLTAGSLIALGVAVAVGFGVWVTRPGELIDPERLIGPDVTGYAEWTLRLEDPGTEAFVSLLLDAAEDPPPLVSNALPPFLGTWLQRARTTRAQREIENTLPLLAAWTVRPGAAMSESDLHLVSASTESLGNQLVLADWVAGLVLGRLSNASVHGYRGEKIYRFDTPDDSFGTTLFARRGAVFATSDLDTARQAVDLLAESETSNRPRTALEQLFDTTDDTAALRAAVTNGNNELARIWERVSGERLDPIDAWRLIQSAALGGGLREDGSFHAVLDLIADESAPLETYRSAVETALEINLKDIPFEFAIQAIAIDNGIRIDITIPDLVESLSAWLEESSRGWRGPDDFDID